MCRPMSRRYPNQRRTGRQVEGSFAPGRTKPPDTTLPYRRAGQSMTNENPSSKVKSTLFDGAGQKTVQYRLGIMNLELSRLLPLIFALVEAFEHGKAGFFGIRDGERLEFMRGGEARNDFAHRLFAGRAIGQGFGREGAVQGKLAAAGPALALAEFVFVEGHVRITLGLPCLEESVSHDR